jgi:hypothetical protein
MAGRRARQMRTGKQAYFDINVFTSAGLPFSRIVEENPNV